MSFRRVKAGDPVKIPAPAYNAWCEAAEAFRAGNQGFLTPTAGDRPDHTRVKVRNDSGDDRARFDVLGISGPLFTPTDNLAEFLRAPKLIGVLPDADTHAGRFVILLEPLPAGKIGWALAAGVVPVTVNMVTADDKFADVTDGQAGYLTSGAEGAARILWADTGTGQRRAMVLLGAAGGGMTLFWGTLDEDLAHDDDAGVTVNLDIGGTQEGVLPPPWMTLGTLSEDAHVLIGEIDGEWYVVGAAQAITVITDLQRANGKLQYKTTPALVFVVGDEDAEWADVTGQASIGTQTVVTDFQVSGMTLQTKTRSVYVDPAADESGWTTDHTGTADCPEP
jgi:hypothetical protein